MLIFFCVDSPVLPRTRGFSREPPVVLDPARGVPRRRVWAMLGCRPGGVKPLRGRWHDEGFQACTIGGRGANEYAVPRKCRKQSCPQKAESPESRERQKACPQKAPVPRKRCGGRGRWPRLESLRASNSAGGSCRNAAPRRIGRRRGGTVERERNRLTVPNAPPERPRSDNFAHENGDRARPFVSVR